ncbi:cell division protein FtsH, partial [Deinococcus navajonensis]
MNWPRWAWVLLGGAALLLGVIVWVMPRGGPEDLNNTAFVAALQRGEVRSAILSGQNGTVSVRGQLSSGATYQTRALAADPVLRLEALQARGVNVQYAAIPRLTGLGVLSGLLTLALIVGLVMVLLRRNSGTQDTASAFGKTRASVVMEGQVKVTFSDVAG